ncbi:2-succinyl-6-hydroxy-2,4-cyclohexadiene-1-carboxylate synthase [Enterococcus sp. 7E2_DIV0204]|uniref:2-succinyl-6-hydroxy-2, 4-cyclohexadiene-1-carboxylate synthase n=1 Tax=unclassified Enterococcus TaxID=2608891 RepID=UPI000A348D38|nr:MULTISPECIES: 2-succinyl-6-hydroxy-2,4-cyclohexadiene-1-carboxylate synthase [unclassified Enterococcus]OTN88791.1 2-succinyl-6-hydroxy-2,4-cyclohexadiene-1-carboxylate synthase [Enterococcus sp. 7E2_DIV0204]OTP51255.1 2-succinyl-6-hydroxy-2,4-cyclohexadiene-1-carboxylate synthase [Enterococcus sp. 7D2_DIV0200]
MNATINGVNYYYEWFSEYKAKRPTVVCFHGFTGTSQTFAPVFLKERELNILAIDLIGHGKTDCYVHPYRYQMDCLCQDIAILTEQLGIFKFSLLGYSMGARAALGFAYLFPQKIQQLILESGSPGLKGKTERILRKYSDEHLAGFIMSHSIEAFVEKWEKLPLFASQKKLSIQVQEAVRQERLAQRNFGLACSLWFMGTGVQPDFWPELDKLKVPTLLIVGELDHKFQQIASKMKERQPAFLIEIVSNTGHCIHLEKPQTFEKIVISFVTSSSEDS